MQSYSCIKKLGGVIPGFQSAFQRLAFKAKVFAKAFGLVGAAHLESYMAKRGLVLGLNTLTGLIPTMYEAFDIVSRELTGFLPAVTRNSTADRVALNQTITIPIVPAIAGGDVTPGPTPPNDGDQAFGNTTMTIDKSRYWPIRWTGEEQKAVRSSGMFPSIAAQQFAQAIRAAVNEMEADLASLYIESSRAYGTPGTAPFGVAGDLSDFAQSLRILDDNGAPGGDRQMVLGSAATANLRGKQSVLFKVNESGTSDLLRRGIIGQVESFDLHNSAAVKTVTKGTGAGYTSNAAGYAVGATSITLITGTGTILAGDSITFAGDSNKYIVKTGIAAPGTIVLQEPGLRVAIPAAATAVTVENTATRNMAFSRSAIMFSTRAPALPVINGVPRDMADDRIFITDPNTGLVFEVSMYLQYRQVKYELAAAWGKKVVTPRHVMVLQG